MNNKSYSCTCYKFQLFLTILKSQILCDTSLSVTCGMSVVFSQQKTDSHDITVILQKATLITLIMLSDFYFLLHVIAAISDRGQGSWVYCNIRPSKGIPIQGWLNLSPQFHKRCKRHQLTTEECHQITKSQVCLTR